MVSRRYSYTYCTLLHVSLHSYKAALEAKKERTSKVAASYGPKIRYQGNPKQVCMLQCYQFIMMYRE